MTSFMIPPFRNQSDDTHVKTNVVRDGIRYVNPGSVSIPKDGSNSYAVYEDGEFTLKELV